MNHSEHELYIVLKVLNPVLLCILMGNVVFFPVCKSAQDIKSSKTVQYVSHCSLSALSIEGMVFNRNLVKFFVCAIVGYFGG